MVNGEMIVVFSHLQNLTMKTKMKMKDKKKEKLYFRWDENIRHKV